MPDKINDLWPDDTLLALVKAGDKEAFAVIYNKYWSKLYVSAFNMLRDTQACEDIVQDILVQLWLRRESANIASLPAYLHTSVRYQVFTFIKSGNAQNFRLENIEEPASADNLNDLMDEEDLRYLLNERVLALPEKCREIFLLSRNGHFTNREIAAMLHIAPKTVENQLTIALRRLRISMKNFLCLALITFNFFG
jgi:RNA polymerase sigma-70 factor (family 1)